MQHSPSAIIFDMDGLMLDTEPLAARAWESAAVHVNVEFDAALGRRMIGRNGHGCRELLVTHYGDASLAARLMETWHEAYAALIDSENVAVKPGLTELLAFLDASDIPKAVATSTGHKRARSKLDRANLLDRFPVIVGGDEVAHGKPAPDIFLTAAARLRAPADRCIVLEDSEPGVAAAWAAGMTPIMIPDLHPPSDDLLVRRLLVMPSLHEVCAYLKAVATTA